MAALFAGREQELDRPDEAKWPEWSGYVQHAFYQLRDDRHYGATGGLGRVWWDSINNYAEKRGIVGSSFDDFETFFRAVDDEYVAVQNERAKEEADKNKKDT